MVENLSHRLVSTPLNLINSAFSFIEFIIPSLFIIKPPPIVLHYSGYLKLPVCIALIRTTQSSDF
jgi:hypothetical protein